MSGLALAPPEPIVESQEYTKILRNLKIKERYFEENKSWNINLEAIKRPEFALLRHIFAKYMKIGDYIDTWTRETTIAFMRFYQLCKADAPELRGLITSSIREIPRLLSSSFREPIISTRANINEYVTTIMSMLAHDIHSFANYRISSDISHLDDSQNSDYSSEEANEDEAIHQEADEADVSVNLQGADIDDSDSENWDRISTLLPDVCRTEDVNPILDILKDIFYDDIIEGITSPLTQFIKEYCIDRKDEIVGRFVRSRGEEDDVGYQIHLFTLWNFAEELKNFINRGSTTRKKDSLFTQTQKNNYGRCLLSLIGEYEGEGMVVKLSDFDRLEDDNNFQRRIRCASLFRCSMKSSRMVIRQRNDRIHDFIESRLEKWFPTEKFKGRMDDELIEIIGHDMMEEVRAKFSDDKIELNMVKDIMEEIFSLRMAEEVSVPLTEKLLPLVTGSRQKTLYQDNAAAINGPARPIIDARAERIDTIAVRTDGGGTASGATVSLLAFANVLYHFEDGIGFYFTHQVTRRPEADGGITVELTTIMAYVKIPSDPTREPYTILGSSSIKIDFMKQTVDGQWDFTGDEITLSLAAVRAIEIMTRSKSSNINESYDSHLDGCLKWGGDWSYIPYRNGPNVAGFKNNGTPFTCYIFGDLSNVDGRDDTIIKYPEEFVPPHLIGPYLTVGCDRPAACTEIDFTMRCNYERIPTPLSPHNIGIWLACLGDPGLQMNVELDADGVITKTELYVCEARKFGVIPHGGGSSASSMATDDCSSCRGTGATHSNSSGICSECRGTGKMSGGGPTSTYYYELLPFIYVDPEILDYLNYNIVISNKAIGYLQYMYSLQYILYDVFFLLSSNKDNTSVIFPVYNKSKGIDKADVTKKLKYDTEEEILMKIHISNLIKSLLTRISQTTLTKTISELLNSSINPQDTKVSQFFEIDTFKKNGNDERKQLESSVIPYIDNINTDEYLIKMLININKYNPTILTPFLSLTLRQVFDNANDKLGMNFSLYPNVKSVVKPLQIQSFQNKSFQNKSFQKMTLSPSNPIILAKGGKKTKRLRKNAINKAKHKKTKKPKKIKKSNKFTKNINKIKIKKSRKTRKQIK